MARLFRSNISHLRDCSNNSYRDIVSPVGAYDVSDLLRIASNNQQLPSMHTYSYLNSPVDLSKPMPKVTNLVQYFSLASENSRNINDIKAQMDAAEKAKAEAAQIAHDAEVIAKYEASKQ